MTSDEVHDGPAQRAGTPPPRVEVLHVRDPDGYCEVTVYWDGVVVDATEESVDPGAGHDGDEWDEQTREVGDNASYTQPFRAAVQQARRAAADSTYIQRDQIDI